MAMLLRQRFISGSALIACRYLFFLLHADLSASYAACLYFVVPYNSTLPASAMPDSTSEIAGACRRTAVGSGPR